jgi:hypothetical protein
LDTISFWLTFIIIDPFKRLDKNGVGSLIAMAIRLIRYGRVIQFPRREFSTFQIGVFGGQLGNRGTLEYFNDMGVDFVWLHSLRLF